jgi:hypothetical protein
LDCRKAGGIQLGRFKMFPQFEKLYSPKEAAGILCCSRDAVVRMMNRGDLDYIQFPRMGGRGINVKRLLRESVLVLFLRKNTKKGE